MADRLVFSKTKRAVFISHLDLMRTFQRAFNRAGIQIRHTEGFNPHPFVSIALPLSLGYSSQWEILEFGLVSGATKESLPAQLTAVMPEGIEIHECYSSDIKMKHLIDMDYELTLRYPSGLREEAKTAWTEFLQRDSCVIEKKSKKSKTGLVTLDIMPMVKNAQVEEAEEGLRISPRLLAQNPGLNPDLLRKAFVEHHPTLAPQSMTCHRVAVFDKDGNPFR